MAVSGVPDLAQEVRRARSWVSRWVRRVERSFVEMAERRCSLRLRSGRGWVVIVVVLEMVYEKKGSQNDLSYVGSRRAFFSLVIQIDGFAIIVLFSVLPLFCLMKKKKSVLGHR